MKKFKIYDWAGNEICPTEFFDSFEEAWERVTEFATDSLIREHAEKFKDPDFKESDEYDTLLDVEEGEYQVLEIGEIK